MKVLKLDAKMAIFSCGYCGDLSSFPDELEQERTFPVFQEAE
jgi:hypothetical protein